MWGIKIAEQRLSVVEKGGEKLEERRGHHLEFPEQKLAGRGNSLAYKKNRRVVGGMGIEPGSSHIGSGRSGSRGNLTKEVDAGTEGKGGGGDRPYTPPLWIRHCS